MMADYLKLPFTTTSPPDRFNPDDDVRIEPLNHNRIKLSVYEWTVSNFSMITPKPQAACSPEFITGMSNDATVKMTFSVNSDNTLKIEIVLESTKSDDVSKLLGDNLYCNNASLKLEYLDSKGKILDYYIKLPYESKHALYNDTIKNYVWKKEENVSRFIENDSLTIRAKFCFGYRSSKCKNYENDDLLVEDIKKLIKSDIFPDMVVKVGGQSFLSHRAILIPQLVSINPNLYERQRETSESSGGRALSPNVSCETISIPNVNADVFLAALYYFYCGKILISDAATSFGLYEFAKKYRLSELCTSLQPDEMTSHSVVTPFKGSFYWYVHDYSNLSQKKFSLTQSPGYKIRIGDCDITWIVSLFFFDLHNISLSLHKVEDVDKDVQMLFKLAVLNTDRTPYEEHEYRHCFGNSKLNTYPGFMEPASRFSIDPSLFPDDTLIIFCDITATDGQMTVDTKRTYPGNTLNREFRSWSKNLRNLLESETYSDVLFLVDGKEFKAHKFILSIRSPVFSRMLNTDMAEKESGRVIIDDVSSTAFECALTYIYTGEFGDLTINYAPELYRTADKYEILELKDKCAEFIMEHLDADTACEVMILAELFEDTKLKEAAKNIICRRASQALLTSHGLEMMTNYPHLAHDILENLSAVFCSLPPQDVYNKAE